MTKQQILQDLFKWNWQTIWHISQKDVCDDTGINIKTLNAYVKWAYKTSDETMSKIIESAGKIAKSKYDFSLSVKCSWRSD